MQEHRRVSFHLYRFSELKEDPRSNSRESSETRKNIRAKQGRLWKKKNPLKDSLIEFKGSFKYPMQMCEFANIFWPLRFIKFQSVANRDTVNRPSYTDQTAKASSQNIPKVKGHFRGIYPPHSKLIKPYNSITDYRHLHSFMETRLHDLISALRTLYPNSTWVKSSTY